MMAVPPLFLLLILFLLMGCSFFYIGTFSFVNWVFGGAFGISAYLLIFHRGTTANWGIMFYSMLLVINIAIFLLFNIIFTVYDTSRGRQIAVVCAIILCIMISLAMIGSADSNMVVGNHYTRCLSRMGQLSDAMEAYYSNNKKYPDNLEQLVPVYFQKVHQCDDGSKEISPIAKQHYEKYYGVSIKPYEYQVSDDRSTFTILCKGRNHLHIGLDPDMPRVISKQGLIPR
ncbi:MAG: hypothetical protein LWY06_05895 [Firmicutes bacterium]|nr:hypothetical protein [Bacillota bacterium]